MAVTYTIPSVTPIVIGGEINPANGLAGPFPRYSISRESISKDTLYIANKYNISITGTALITSSASMLDAGARQNEIHEIIKTILQAESKQGLLEIAPYGGKANILEFQDAVLTNVESPEQSDTSQGVQSQEYTFTFEAYELTVSGSTKDDENYLETIANGTFAYLSDVSESWDYNVNEEYSQTEYSDPDVNPSKVFRTYTITHNISATGRSRAAGAVVKSGWLQAKQYVDDRIEQLGNDPFSTVVTDYSRTTEQEIDLRDKIEDPDIDAYNLHQTYSKDILEGTYSVTRTWTAARQKASSSIELELNEDPTAEFNTISVNVSIAGYETFEGTDKPDRSTSNKYKEAVKLFDDYFSKSQLQTIAQKFYENRLPDSTSSIRNEPSSLSQTHNQTDGTISVSATFDDDVVPEGVLSQSVSINSVNEDGLDQVVAILAVIAKADGPIIQDMKTTKERKRSISMTRVMDRDNRATIPDGYAYVETYFKPKFSGDGPEVYRESMTETWNYKSGQYDISVDYVWTDDQPLRNVPNEI